MEKEVTTTTTTTTAAVVATNNTTISNNKNINGKTKKRGALHMLRVALFMLQLGSTNKKSKSVHVEVASKGLWKKIVAAMRPLHNHPLPNQNSTPPPSILTAPTSTNPKAPAPNDSLFHDVLTPPMSPHVLQPDTPSSSASSSVDSMSRYASAQNLQELDRREEYSNNCDINNVLMEEEDGDYFYGGDALIDAKAEEFISHFYEQMRLQQLDLLNRYNERKRKKKEPMDEGN